MLKIILALLISLPVLAQKQDSLPDFSVVYKGNNRVVVSWNNKFKLLKQISIQRSADSLSNFKTLVTVPDPNNPQNGYMDAKAPNDRMFYRLYILVDGSNFIFTRSKRPLNDSIRTALLADTSKKTLPDSNYMKVVEKIISQNLPDSVLTAEEIFILKKYKNSRLDLLSESVNRKIEAIIKVKNTPDVVMPQYRISANRDGVVKIILNDFNKKKYTIRFYEDDDSFLFEIKDIKEASLMLDKSNFYHSGWFRSELYEDGRLVEKNRFFIPKDF